MTTTTSPAEAMSQWSEQIGTAMQDWWDSSSQTWEPLWRAWSEPFASMANAMGQPARGRTTGGCGCGDECGCGGQHERPARDCGCGTRGSSCCDPCACCIPGADIVVHTRVGERRIVPFELANERHRDREVTLAVGDWTACDGPAVRIEALLDPDGAITLAPCERRTVRLLVGVLAPAPDQSDPAAAGKGQKGNQKPDPKDQGRGDKGDERVADVDACASAYADVRFEGCARPVRVAIVVHPLACDAIPVSCSCGCCC